MAIRRAAGNGHLELSNRYFHILELLRQLRLMQHSFMQLHYEIVKILISDFREKDLAVHILWVYQLHRSSIILCREKRCGSCICRQELTFDKT